MKRVLNLKLSSEWNIQQKDNLAYVTKSDSQHMVPLYEIFIGERLRFQLKVLVWALPDNHQIYGQYNSSSENIFPSNLVYNLNSYNLCQRIQDNLSIDYVLLVEHSIPKVFHFKKINSPYINLFLLIK